MASRNDTPSGRAEHIKENFFSEDWYSMERSIDDAMDEIIYEVECLENQVEDLEQELKEANEAIEAYEKREDKIPDRLQAIYITLARTVNYLQDAMKESNIEIPDTIDNLGSRIGGDPSHQGGDDQGATEDQTGGVVRPQVP